MKRVFSRGVGSAALGILAAGLLLGAAGCAEREEAVFTIEAPRRALRIGLIPEQNIFSQKARYKPLAAYLSKRADVQIELKVLSRYGNIIQNFVSNRLDGAFFGSFTGALAHRKLGVEALARPEYLDGTSAYHGLLFVRMDSGIANANDMRGKRFVFVDKATTAGWLLPLYYFKTQGIEDYHSWLRETYFAGTHESAIYDVLERTADIGAAKNTVFSRLASEDPRITDELVILARSPNVPENALCVRGDLDTSLKLRLRNLLLNMDQDPEAAAVLAEFGARRFIATGKSDYASVFEYAEKIGLDLETYDYMND
ncbi:MAG TPA: phosphate/phosphite/phosphonate ABC transporter substrate-binding protein [Myxococcota bacterium]